MTYPRSSALESSLESLGPIWTERFGMRVPLRFREIEEERKQFENLAICDLSALPKMGVKGRGAVACLREEGLTVPERIYGWRQLEDGGLAIRTDRNEVFLEEGIEGSTLAGLSKKLGRGATSVDRVERQDTCLLLSGSRAIEVLRQTCSFNFSVESETVVMTRIALVSCMVLSCREAGVPVYRIWCIPSYGVYLWENLLQIVAELGGDAVGVECVEMS